MQGNGEDELYSEFQQEILEKEVKAEELLSTAKRIYTNFHIARNPQFASLRTHKEAQSLIPKVISTAAYNNSIAAYQRYKTAFEMMTRAAKKSLRKLQKIADNAAALPQLAPETLASHKEAALKQMRNLQALQEPVLADYAAEMNSAWKALATRRVDVDKVNQHLQSELVEWAEEVNILKNDVAHHLQHASTQFKPQTIHRLKTEADRRITRRIATANTQLRKLKAAWESLAADSAAVELAFFPIYESFQQKMEGLRKAQELVDVLLKEYDRVEKRIAAELQASVLTFRKETLQGGKPLANLKPLVAIYTVNPPPGAAPPSTPGWFSDKFSPLLQLEPCLQLLHYYTPFGAPSGRTLVVGDDLVEAARCVALCASAFVRARKKVRVTVPSESVRKVLLAAIYDGWYDVNLQQLVVGLGRQLSGNRKELQELGAAYPIELSSGKRAVDLEEVEMFLFPKPDKVPTSTGKQLVCIPWIDAETLRLEPPQLEGRVFSIPPQPLPRPDYISHRLPYVHPFPIAASREALLQLLLDPASPNLAALVDLVARMAGPNLQGIYIGSADAPPSSLQSTLSLLGKAGIAAVECSTLAHWERAQQKGDKVLVFPKPQDPGFVHAVRGKIEVLHVFLPQVDWLVVERTFAPAKIIRYEWGKEVVAAMELREELSAKDLAAQRKRFASVAVNKLT